MVAEGAWRVRQMVVMVVGEGFVGSVSAKQDHGEVVCGEVAEC